MTSEKKAKRREEIFEEIKQSTWMSISTSIYLMKLVDADFNRITTTEDEE